MQLVLVVIIGFIAYFYFIATTKHQPNPERQKIRKKWLLGVGLVLLAVLAFTRGQVIIGAIASLVALVMRGLPLLKYFPILKGVFGHFEESVAKPNMEGTRSMTRSQAAEILGLEDDASEVQVIEAHKRLIQKLHPDKGGSEALAAQINLARKVLLGLERG